MILPPYLAKLVRRGLKTQSRIPVRIGARRPGGSRSSPTIYGIQPGRGEKAIAHVLVTDVRRERLGDITDRDARAEGFRTREQFFAHWRDLHGHGLPTAQRDLLERVVDAPASLPLGAVHPGLPPRTLAARVGALRRAGLLVPSSNGHVDITDKGSHLLIDPYEGIDIGRDVWVITFELADFRLLTPIGRPAGHAVYRSGQERVEQSGWAGGGPDAEIGYTLRPEESEPDEIETVDPDRLRPEWRERAAARHRKVRGEEFGRRRARTLAERVRQQARRVDGDAPELDLIENLLEQLESRQDAA